LASLPIDEWSKALLRPCAFLGIPKGKVLFFQISALVSLDHIWLARNTLVHDGTNPDPANSLKSVISAVKSHLKAWKDYHLSP
jgi:hypothetical protein